MRAVVFGLIGAVLIVGAAPAASSDQPAPFNSWAEIRAAFVQCWKVPPGTDGSVISFTFLLAPNGGLRGPPRILARILKGEQEAKGRYEAAAYATLDRCLPLKITPEFKMVMGETPIMLRFVNTPRQPARNLGPMMSIFADEASAEQHAEGK